MMFTLIFKLFFVRYTKMSREKKSISKLQFNNKKPTTVAQNI